MSDPTLPLIQRVYILQFQVSRHCELQAGYLQHLAKIRRFFLGRILAGVMSMTASRSNTIPMLMVVAFITGCNSPEKDAARPSTTQLDTASRGSSTILASAMLSPASGSTVRGTVTFFDDKGSVRVVAELRGLTPGSHGFHIHEKGDCSAPDATSAGGHFNPTGMQHGGPDAAMRHVGDFGNLEANAEGYAMFDKSFPDLKFEGAASILGKAVIVHAKADDLESQPSGDAGSRVACGVIERK